MSQEDRERVDPHVIVIFARTPQEEGVKAIDQVQECIGPFQNGDMADAFIAEHGLNETSHRDGRPLDWLIVPVEYPGPWINALHAGGSLEEES